jgi:acyl transferase domain-containing protein
MENSTFEKPHHMKSPPKIAFVFTGQGAQHYRMGRVLMCYPVFKKSLEDAAAFFKTLGEGEWDLLGTVHSYN